MARCASCASGQVPLTDHGRCPVCGTTIAARVRAPSQVGGASPGQAGCSLVAGGALLLVAWKTGLGFGDASLGQVPAGVTSPLLFLLGATAALGAYLLLGGGLFGLLAAVVGPLPGRLRLPPPDPGSAPPGRSMGAGCGAAALALVLTPLLIVAPCLLSAWVSSGADGPGWAELVVGLRRTHLLGPIGALAAAGLLVRLARIGFSAQRRLGRFALLTVGLALGLSATGYALAIGLPGWLGLGAGWPEVAVALVGLAFLSTASRWALFGPLEALATPEHMPHALESALLFAEDTLDPLWEPWELILSLSIAALLLPGALLSLALDRGVAAATSGPRAGRGGP